MVFKGILHLDPLGKGSLLAIFGFTKVFFLMIISLQQLTDHNLGPRYVGAALMHFMISDARGRGRGE